ncbi:MAG: PrsW family intramembrane metalloprotease [Bacteroidia bacterium]|nr:PrsW family intramembrane metalloprotease [Bacteroidia bacterium]
MIKKYLLAGTLVTLVLFILLTIFAREWVFTLLWIYLIFLVVVAYLAYLYRIFPAHSKGGESFSKFAFRDGLLRSFFLVVLVLGIGNAFIPAERFSTAQEMVELGKLRDEAHWVEKGQKALMKHDPANLDLNYQWVEAMYAQPASWVTREGRDFRREWDVNFYYRDLDTVPGMKNIHPLGMGMFHFHQGEYEEALIRLMPLAKERVKYGNFLVGKTLFKMAEIPPRFVEFRGMNPDYLGKIFLGREIEQQGYVEGAYAVMAWKLYHEGRLEFLAHKLNDPVVRDYIPMPIKREVSLKQGKLVDYYQAVFSHLQKSLNLTGFLGALLILVVWVAYLRKVDAFRKEKWFWMISTVVLGGLFSWLVEPMSDVLLFYGNYNLNGHFWHDLGYSVLAIGLVEELVKFLPFFLVVYIFRQADEAVDYLIYAGASALGFAFVENLLYIDPAHSYIIHARALSASIGHLFDACLVAYGLILAKWRYQRPAWQFLPLFLLLAALSHGFYDFWLVSKSTADFSLISTGFLFINVVFLAIMFNNALNISPWLDRSRLPGMRILGGQLALGLTAVLMFEYLGMGLIYNVSEANNQFFYNLASGSYLMAFAAIQLSRMDVRPGAWEALKLLRKGAGLDHNQALGLELTLLPSRKSGKLAPALPLRGKITERIALNEGTGYMVLTLEKPLSRNGIIYEMVLLAPEDRAEILHKGRRQRVMVITVDNPQLIFQEEKNRRDFKLVGYALVE